MNIASDTEITTESFGDKVRVTWTVARAAITKCHKLADLKQ